MKLDITERAPVALWKRLAWFVAIWSMSVGVLVLVAQAIRMVLKT
jgi:Protein of unknown function (DUF2474)